MKEPTRVAKKPRRVLAYWSVLLASCAGGQGQGSPGEAGELDSITGDRRLGLVVGFFGTEDNVAYRETLVRHLTRQLRRTFRTEVHGLAVRGAPTLDPDTFVALAENGADDALLVRILRNPGSISSFDARIQVVILATGKIHLDFTVENVRGISGGEPEADRLAEVIALSARNRWRDVRAVPRMSLVAAANQLATRGACDHAAHLYARAFAQVEPGSRAELHRVTDSHLQQTPCRDEIGLRRVSPAK